MSLQLPDTIASSQDLASLILEVKGYGTWLRHESIKQTVSHMPVTAAPALSPAATSLLKTLSSAKQLNADGLESLIKTLEKYKKHAPSITMTLAGLPPGSLRSELVGWCRNNIDETILVNFSIDSTLLGGMVVRRGSRVFDWSFRRKLVADYQKFPEVARRV